MSFVAKIRRRLVPAAFDRWWRRADGVDMGDFRRMEPTGRLFGYDRGLPICRYYIERMLAENAQLIKGRVLEVADDGYTRRFGGDRVTACDVLHATAGDGAATIIGDLATGAGIPEARFDCAILTQVLQCVFDVQGAALTVHRLLAPGGTALVTVPAIAPISRYDVERWGEFWHFTEQSVRRLFEPHFAAANLRIAAYGNAVVAHAYLAGMASEELSETELLAHDADFPVLITAVATRP